MPKITSKLPDQNTYTDHASAKDGKCPSVTISPGDNEITDNQLATLRKVPAYAAHVDGGYIVEGKTPKKTQVHAEESAEGAK